MSTTTKKPSPSRRKPANIANVEPPLLLRTEKEVQEYLAAHLTPVRRGPKGQPIYSQKDIEKLNVRLYADS